MTAAERDAKVAELEQLSDALRSKIGENTDAARKFNEENRTLIKQRRDIEHALHHLRKVKVDEGASV